MEFKRRKTALILMISAMVLFLWGMDWPVFGQSGFRDISGKEWYAEDIGALANNPNGIIKGYPDNTFRPEQTIGVDEFITMLVRASGEKVDSNSEYWAIPYLQKARSLGILVEGDFLDFSAPLTREQMALLAVNYIKSVEEKGMEKIKTQDTSLAWMRDKASISINQKNEIPKYRQRIGQAYAYGIVQGYEDGRFLPQKIVNRSEATAVLMRIVDKNRRKEPIYNGDGEVENKEKEQNVEKEELLSIQNQDAKVHFNGKKEIIRIPVATNYSGAKLTIGSNTRDNQIFDVEKGIPTGEKLFAQVTADEFIAEYSYKTVQEGQRQDAEAEQGLTYQEFTKVKVYAIESVEIISPVLPNQKIVMKPKSNSVSASVQPAVYRQGKIQNAMLTINGKTIQAGEDLPKANTIDRDILYREDIIIPVQIANLQNVKTVAKIRYKSILEYGDKPSYKEKTVEANSISTLTPVVSFPEVKPRGVKGNEKFPQAKKGQKLYVKEESFQVQFTAVGEHIDLPGYGKRDYAQYTAKRQILFSFDVYAGKDYNGKYMPAKVWHDFPENSNKEDIANFFIPAWVKDGNEHFILFRSIPTNYQAEEKEPVFEFGANKDAANYKAVAQEEVSIYGKITATKVLQIGDDTSESVRQFPMYPKKQANQTLKAISLGKSVDFMLTTNGELLQRGDGVSILPKYYFINKKGKKTEVDVYYQKDKQFHRIDQNNHRVEQIARLKDYKGWTENQWFKDTAQVLVSQKRENGLDYQGYLDSLQGNAYIATGNNSILNIGDKLKLYSGRQLLELGVRPKNVSELEIIRAKQNWYFRFYMPKEIVLVPKGTKPSNSENHLKDGFLLVNFEIQLLQGNRVIYAYLIEPKSISTLPYYAGNGDILFYQID